MALTNPTQALHNARGSFPCGACGCTTNGAEGDVSTRLCGPCYDLTGIFNEYQDGLMSIGLMNSVELKERAQEIRELAADILMAGGNLDGDALELLTWAAKVK